MILDFTPDTAPSLLNAAVAQGLVNQVKWGSSTPIANTQMARQEKAFDGKMFINSELALLTSKGPDETLYNQINAKYTPKIAIQSFGQIGYMDAKFATQALLSIKGPVTAKSYNLAVREPEGPVRRTCCASRGTSATHCRTTSRTTGTSRSTTRTAGRPEDRAASRSPPVDPQIAQTRVWEKKYHLQG